MNYTVHFSDGKIVAPEMSAFLFKWDAIWYAKHVPTTSPVVVVRDSKSGVKIFTIERRGFTV